MAVTIDATAGGANANSYITLAEADAFVEAMVAILAEAEVDASKLKGAPWTMPVRRLDDVRAAKQLELTWKPVNSAA